MERSRMLVRARAAPQPRARPPRPLRDPDAPELDEDDAGGEAD
ncbi:hypothetical protein ACFZCP_41465 [Streptomyces sp. NPDC007971]